MSDPDRSQKLRQPTGDAPPLAIRRVAKPPKDSSIGRFLAQKGDLFSTIGADTRTAVSVTSSKPWCGIARIVASTNPLITHAGTGFFVAQRWLVTAAHVLTDAIADNGQSLSISVTGAGGDQGFADHLCHPNFAPGQSRDYDVAVLKLRSPVSSNGWLFPLQSLDDAWLTSFIAGNNPAFVAGYSQDMGYRLVDGFDLLQSFSDELILHRVDATSGESGSPLLYMSQQGNIWPLGVHTYGDVNDRARPGVYNTATRLHVGIISWIQRAIAAN